MQDLHSLFHQIANINNMNIQLCPSENFKKKKKKKKSEREREREPPPWRSIPMASKAVEDQPPGPPQQWLGMT
jgi:hypothetical protein